MSLDGSQAIARSVGECAIEASIEDCTATLNVVVVDNVIGDVDGNGIVEIDDVNFAINIMLRKSMLGDYSADIDGNGLVDIDDVNRLINILLHKSSKL